MIIRSRFSYWSCSKFANWIRGEEKPYALPLGEWENWRKKLKRERPLRYWLSENFLNSLQNILYFPYDLYTTIRIYIRNRWFDQTHILKTGLKPGNYYDLDTKILHGLFTELVDLVEIEMAYLSRWDKSKQYDFHQGRCQQAGLDYLDRSSSTVYDEDYGISKKDKRYNQATSEAIASQKIRELYLWWKNIRPNRPDPFVVSGYADSNTDDHIFDFAMDKKSLTRMKKYDKIEQAYYKEDNDKLIQLIKLREHLWV